MRGVLMILILVLHSAYVFDPAKVWGIYSEQSTFFATILIETIRVFALPAFFVVSGYFAIASLRKDSAMKFLKTRVIMRLLIPTVVTAITLNSLQTYLLVSSGWKEFHTLQEYIITAQWKSHLWFMINLIIYFL
jgi:glucan biosynthesis protein C